MFTSITVIGSDASSTVNIKRPVIQAALFAGNFIIGAVVSVCLVKLFYRFVSVVDNSSSKISASKRNRFSAECMLLISSMIHLARSGLVARHPNSDIIDRMWTCLVVSPCLVLVIIF